MIDKIKKIELLSFLKAHRYGVISTVSEDGAPEAAMVGIAAMDDLTLIFETLNTTRKYENLRRDPRVAMATGWTDEKTLQYEGTWDEPEESEWEALKQIYYAALPEYGSHDGWPGLTYIRVRPRWIRFSNYSLPWSVEEFRFDS
jgi:general stress protein 26